MLWFVSLAEPLTALYGTLQLGQNENPMRICYLPRLLGGLGRKERMMDGQTDRYVCSESKDPQVDTL